MTPTKIARRLNDLTRRFVELSPFVCLSTSGADGSCDVTPRGDPPGFVRILDEQTLLLPERPGNRLADAFRNILENPHVGLLFFVPGVTDTFRVNGRAKIVTDEDLLAPSEVEGKVPKLGLLIEIDEAYTQCSKALAALTPLGRIPSPRAKRASLERRDHGEPQHRGRGRDVRGRAERALRASRGLLLAARQ